VNESTRQWPLSATPRSSHPAIKYPVPQVHVGRQGFASQALATAASQQSNAEVAAITAPREVTGSRRARPSMAVPQLTNPDFYRALTPMVPPPPLPTQIPIAATAADATVKLNANSSTSDPLDISTATLEAAGNQVTEFLAQDGDFWSFIG